MPREHQRPGMLDERVVATDHAPPAGASFVVSYYPGAGIPFDFVTGMPFDDPTAALGYPTVDTTGDGLFLPPTAPVPVVPVYPPFRAFESVSVGFGGQLVLGFDEPVVDDPRNPFGVDFIIYSDSFLVIGGGQAWMNGDPHLTYVSSTVEREPAIVSVSQDGVTWYPFSNGPFADDFAPTLGRVYSPESPDPALGPDNLWWGQPTTPGRPLNPAITPSAIAGLSVAELAELYGHSAGGTGFDLAAVGLTWIRYVRIDGPTSGVDTPEIDAIVDVAASSSDPDAPTGPIEELENDDARTDDGN